MIEIKRNSWKFSNVVFIDGIELLNQEIGSDPIVGKEYIFVRVFDIADGLFTNYHPKCFGQTIIDRPAIEGEPAILELRLSRLLHGFKKRSTIQRLWDEFICLIHEIRQIYYAIKWSKWVIKWQQKRKPVAPVTRAEFNRLKDSFDKAYKPK